MDDESTRRSALVRVDEWLWLIAIVLLSLVVRVPFFRIPMLADEGGYAWATRGWVEGSGALYDDLWISRPQGIFLVYAGIFDLFGTGTTAFRFAAWIAIALTLLAIWAYTRMMAGPVPALAAGAIFAIASASPNLEGYSANAEMFMGFPAALAATWLLATSRAGWRTAHLIGIGLLIGIAISLKPSAAVMIVVAVAFVWMSRRSGTRGENTRRSSWLLSGMSVIGIGSLINGWMIGWDDFVYATITYRIGAQSAATVGVQHNADAIGRLALRALPLLILVSLLLVLLHHRGIFRILCALRTPRRSWDLKLPEKPVGSDARTLINLWLVGAIAGASIGGDWWSHYLIQLVAPLSIWIGVALARLWPHSIRIGRIALVAVTVVLLILPYRVLLAGNIEATTEAMFSHPGYPAQAKVAAYLREHTTPGTTIYVAFDQASIYYLADRPPAYRHLYDQELRGIPSSYADLITIIRSPNRPEFIVSTRQPGPFADESRAFWQEVGQYYEVVETIDNVPIYRDKTKIPP